MKGRCLLRCGAYPSDEAAEPLASDSARQQQSG